MAPRLLLTAVMVFAGIALGAVQLVPLNELVQNNFEAGRSRIKTLWVGLFPKYQILSFLIPDLFGNPTHHSYLDVFEFRTLPAPTGTIFWGRKNYVEAARM